MRTKIIAKSMLVGALGAITPHVVFALFAETLLPSNMAGIGEGIGILMTLACLPTICIGAIFGGLLVWLIVKFEKPSWIFLLMIEQSEDPRRILLVAYIGGFLTGPILGMSLVLLGPVLDFLSK